MGFPFKQLLCPVDFDENAAKALALASHIARQNDGTVYALHVVPMALTRTGMPVYVDLYKGTEEAAHQRLQEFARKRLAGVKYELSVHVGEVAPTILRAAKQFGADVIIMATHGRHGLSRAFLGSVAEMVLRESGCPVLMVRGALPDREAVSHWMTYGPLAASPEEKLASVQAKMREGSFRSMPVVEHGKLVGIISDRDIREHEGYLDRTEVKLAMTSEVVTVTSQTAVKEAARLLQERKIGSLPVVDEGELVGIIAVTDLLGALIESD
jgi:nucleotide-binding universal stress UspA family protein/predicted transcriptional regulator